jgi:hypothetical protein
MPRTKSRSSHSAVSRRRTSRARGSRTSIRPEEVQKIRRYLDFVRAIVGPAPRNGR